MRENTIIVYYSDFGKEAIDYTFINDLMFTLNTEVIERVDTDKIKELSEAVGIPLIAYYAANPKGKNNKLASTIFGLPFVGGLASISKKDEKGEPCGLSVDEMIKLDFYLKNGRLPNKDEWIFVDDYKEIPHNGDEVEDQYDDFLDSDDDYYDDEDEEEETDNQFDLYDYFLNVTVDVTFTKSAFKSTKYKYALPLAFYDQKIVFPHFDEMIKIEVEDILEEAFIIIVSVKEEQFSEGLTIGKPVSISFDHKSLELRDNCHGTITLEMVKDKFDVEDMDGKIHFREILFNKSLNRMENECEKTLERIATKPTDVVILNPSHNGYGILCIGRNSGLIYLTGVSDSPYINDVLDDFYVPLYLDETNVFEDIYENPNGHLIEKRIEIKYSED